MSSKETVIAHPVTLPGIIEGLDTGPVYLGKTHQVSGVFSNLPKNLDAKVALAYRNPLDAATSLVRTFGWSPEFAARQLSDSIKDALSLPPSHTALVSYESATTGHPLRIKALLSSLGIEVNLLQATWVAFKTRKSRFRQISDRLVTSAAIPWDPVTLLHPGHLSKVRRAEQKVDGLAIEAALLEERVQILFYLLLEKFSQSK